MSSSLYAMRICPLWGCYNMPLSPDTQEGLVFQREDLWRYRLDKGDVFGDVITSQWHERDIEQSRRNQERAAQWKLRLKITRG